MNKREQQLLPQYQAQLRLKDRKILHTPNFEGEKGPLERGFDEVTNPSDLHGWVAGFYGPARGPAPFKLDLDPESTSTSNGPIPLWYSRAPGKPPTELLPLLFLQ